MVCSMWLHRVTGGGVCVGPVSLCHRISLFVAVVLPEGVSASLALAVGGQGGESEKSPYLPSR